MKRLTVLIFLTITLSSEAQQLLTLAEIIEKVTTNHPSIKASLADQRQQEALKRTAIDLPKTSVSLMYGQYNSVIKTDNNISLSQTIPFPTLFSSQRKVALAHVKASEVRTAVSKNDLIFQIKSLYQDILYSKALQAMLQRQDSLYSALNNAGALRHRVGESTLLEKTAIETQAMEVRNQLDQNGERVRSLLAQLQLLLQVGEPVDVSGVFMRLPEINSTVTVETNPTLQLWKQQTVIASRQRKVETNRALPDITIGYFNQTLIGNQSIGTQEQYFGPGKRFQGFTVGLAFPLWFSPFTARIKAAAYNREVTSLQAEAYGNALQREVEIALQNLNRSKSSLTYFEQLALPNASLLERQSLLSFKGGDIDYATFLLTLRQALSIRENHLNALYQYNQNNIILEHLIGNP
jgi:cobalt-zinc-cadmium resistance protein CzcA